MIQRRRILVWGKTRPELSQKYRETVCTGGVFDTGGLVRLYPIPLRFFDDEKVFKKYQWIEADVERNLSDPRPESYRISSENITLKGVVKTKSGGDWTPRSTWILRPDHIVSSVESLQREEVLTKRSLGILKPKAILGVSASKVPPIEKDEFEKRWKESQLQYEMQIGGRRIVNPLHASDYRFKVRFTCDDSLCPKPHEFSILDWEVDAHYFRQKASRHNSEEAKKDVVAHLEEVFNDEHDARFFLGNISTHPTNFTIVGLWYPKKQAEKVESGRLF